LDFSEDFYRFWDVQRSQSQRHASPILNVIRSDSAVVMLAHQNVLMTAILGNHDPVICRSLYNACLRLAGESSFGKMSAISIVVPGTKPPNAEARQALANLHRDPSQVIHRSALVFASDGFIGATVRSVAVSILQMVNKKSGHETFQRLDRALVWVTEGLLMPSQGAPPLTEVAIAVANHLQQARRSVA
jgi:hypothetical protein